MKRYGKYLVLAALAVSVIGCNNQPNTPPEQTKLEWPTDCDRAKLTPDDREKCHQYWEAKGHPRIVASPKVLMLDLLPK